MKNDVLKGLIANLKYMEKMETSEDQSESLMKSVITDLLERMGFSFEIDVEKGLEEGKEDIIYNIRTEESNFLIGQYGMNLQALQHIARILVRKKTEERVNFVLDVNSYKKNKNVSIAALAKSSAEQAVQEKKPIILRPMSPYERRLVHMELSKNPEITTESIGEGEERKVVIKPVDMI